MSSASGPGSATTVARETFIASHGGTHPCRAPPPSSTTFQASARTPLRPWPVSRSISRPPSPTRTSVAFSVARCSAAPPPIAKRSRSTRGSGRDAKRRGGITRSWTSARRSVLRNARAAMPVRSDRCATTTVTSHRRAASSRRLPRAIVACAARSCAFSSGPLVV